MYLSNFCIGRVINYRRSREMEARLFAIVQAIVDLIGVLSKTKCVVSFDAMLKVPTTKGEDIMQYVQRALNETSLGETAMFKV